MPVRGNACWTPQRLAYLAATMAWDDGQTLTARWRHACDFAHKTHPHWALGSSYSGFIEALVRETPRLREAIQTRLRRSMQALPSWKFQGWTAFSVDGTRQEAPHTGDNEKVLGCAGKAKSAPQVYLTLMLHLGTGLPWDFRVGPGSASERLHAADMIDALPEDALLVADAGFCGYDLCRKLAVSGRAFLLRVGGNVHLLKKLGYWPKENSDTVYLWPQEKQEASPAVLAAREDKRPLVLRLIRLRLRKGKLGKGKKKPKTIYLITNVMDSSQLSRASARQIYMRRWSEEVFFRSHKQTLGRRTLQSRTGEHCLVESQWLVLAHWLLGMLAATAIARNGGDAGKWSAAKSRDAVRQAMREGRSRRKSRRKRRRGRPATRTLATRLAEALQDDYERKGLKRARNYPRKKRQHEAGPPKIQTANPTQIKKAACLPPPNLHQNWTA